MCLPWVESVDILALRCSSPLSEWRRSKMHDLSRTTWAPYWPAKPVYPSASSWCWARWTCRRWLRESHVETPSWRWPGSLRCTLPRCGFLNLYRLCGSASLAVPCISTSLSCSKKNRVAKNWGLSGENNQASGIFLFFFVYYSRNLLKMVQKYSPDFIIFTPYAHNSIYGKG